MKTFTLTLFFHFVFLSVINAQFIELPFFDDFSSDYENWTTLSLNGDEQWHISGDDGIDGSKCARFYITSNPPQANDDWLVSKTLNTAGSTNIAIEFKYWYHDDGIIPEFYYSTSFSGDVLTTNWTELDNSFWSSKWTWNTASFEIENSGETFVFAIRYQSTTEISNYILIDNFSVKTFEPLVIEKVGESEHFEFYSSLENGEDYWNEISENVDNWYLELCSYWDRPGITPLFNSDEKTSIYMVSPELFAEQSEIELPGWKCGFSHNSSSIVTKLPEGENSIYENSYLNLVKNTLGQFILNKHFEGVESYFKEAFGLFYSGYQPKRDSILKAISIIGESPSIDVLNDISNLSTSYQKDLITSFVESKVLSVGGVQNCYYGGMTEHWYSHLEYYYKKPDNERIKLLKQTDRFNIYAADSDLPHLNAISEKLEEQLSYYETTFEFPIKHRLFCVVYPTIQARGDCLIFSSGNGGSGWSGDKLDISSKNEGWQDDDYYGFLIPHELFHVYHFNLVKHLFTLPAIYSEGLASYMSLQNNPGYLDGTEWQLYKINDAFHFYKFNFHKDPTFEDMLNAQAYEQFGGYYNDPYYFGELFYKYLLPSVVNYDDLKTLFYNNIDYSKIGKSYDVIAKGYISFLKKHAHLIPSEQAMEIPFFELFNDFNNGWGKPSYLSPDNWLIYDGGTNGTNCARLYISSDKNIPIESWLISPPINAANLGKVHISFDFARYGDEFEVDVFYTDTFAEFTDSTDWSSLKSVEMPLNRSWSNSGEITINNPPDTLFIGLRMKSTGEQHQQFYIDNFEVNGIGTGIKEINPSQNDFKVYPNPINNQSVISFQIQNNENINVSVFDIQGRKIKTLLNGNIQVGKHTIHLQNLISGSGIYFCKLTTDEGISIIKLIKNE